MPRLYPDAPPERALVATAFGAPKYIHLSRADKVARLKAWRN
ncbi:MAG: hypothetical protein JKY00_00305 [Roseicyclus sp.]|nr:hypothetical protein [Roseicyclus sp.]